MKKCEFDRETLALYDVDDLTRKLVYEHIAGCSNCAQIVEQYRMNATLLFQASSETELKDIRTGKKEKPRNLGRRMATAAVLVLVFCAIAVAPAIAQFTKTLGLGRMLRSGHGRDNIVFPVAGLGTGPSDGVEFFPVEGYADKPSGEIRWHRDTPQGTYVSIETQDEYEAELFLGRELGLPPSWSGALVVYRYNDGNGKLQSWGVSLTSVSLTYARDFVGIEVALPPSIDGTEILLSKRLSSDGKLLEAHVGGAELGYWAAYTHDGAPNDVIDFSSDMTVRTEEHTLVDGYAALLILSETPSKVRTDFLLVREEQWLYGVTTADGVNSQDDIDQLIKIMESRRKR